MQSIHDLKKSGILAPLTDNTCEVIMMGYNDRWDVGDPIGMGNDIGAPEVPYMSYGPKPEESEEEIEEREREEEQRKIERLKSRAKRISDEAWELYKDCRNDDALIFIDRSLELYRTANSYNIKAIILEGLERYPDALFYYDKAIELSTSEIIRGNKAMCLITYSKYLKDIGFDEESLEKIEKSLEIFQEISDKRYEDEAWNLKGILLEKSGNIPDAFNCYKRALEFAPKKSEMKQTYLENRDRLLQYIENTDVICPKCGKKLKITDVFCIKCGAHIVDLIRPVLKDPDSNEKKLK